MTDTLYDEDFVVWTERQAEALRHAARIGSNLPLDFENLAEEIESVGRSERREVKSLVNLIISHVLKLSYSPSLETRVGWEGEISRWRYLLRETLADSPSQRPSFPAVVAAEVPRAVRSAARSLRDYGEGEAAAEMERNPPDITAEQVLDEDWFLPGTRFDPAHAVAREAP